MKKSLIISMALMLATCLTLILPSTATADLQRILLPTDSAMKSDDFYFTVKDREATIVQYIDLSDAYYIEPDMVIVTIPETLNEYPVTRIGEQAFFEAALDGVVISDGVTAIGDAAFYYCEHMTSLTIPESVVTIGEYAFGGCSGLTEIALPSGITVIGENTFNNCTRLTSVALPAGVVSIGEGAFAECYSLTDITIPSGVTAIEAWTFDGCRELTGATLPEGLHSIGSRAFEDCVKLRNITLPRGVTQIDMDAFLGCPDLTLTVAEGSYAEAYAKGNGISYELYTSAPATASMIQRDDTHGAYEADGAADTHAEPLSSPDAYRELYWELTAERRLDESAEAFDTWRSLVSPNGETPAYRLADEAFEAGRYEEAVSLYRETLDARDRLYEEARAENGEADPFDVFPVRVWSRLGSAYLRLSRYEEAAALFDELAEWYPSYYDIPEVFYNQHAEALLELGRIGEAKATLYESFGLWENIRGQELLAKIEAALPAKAAKVFESAEWDGYEPVATAQYQWPAVGMVVTVMRKDGHNVLCLLTDEGTDGYRLVVANDRAVYQDDRVPSLFIDDGMGFVCFEYTDEDPYLGSRSTEGYVFCSRWYWEEEMEKAAVGDWEYMLLDAYRLYPEPHAYYGMTRVSMDIADGGLRLQSRYEPYGDSWEAWEPLAKMDSDTTCYDLAVFDIARCNEDFDTLETVSGIAGNGADFNAPETYETSVGSGPLTPYQSDGKWGFADAAGEIVIPCQWEDVGAFYNGLARVKQNGNWGYIDTSGELVIEPQWDDAFPFFEGFLSKDLAFVVQVNHLNRNKYGLIDTKGNVVVKPQWDSFVPAAEGVAIIVTDKKYGYVDHTGKVLAIPQYDVALPFSDGLGRAAKGNQWGFITTEGTVAGQPWDYVFEFSEGLALVKKDGLFGYIDASGKTIIEPRWEDAQSFCEGFAFVKKNGLWGVIDAAGNVAAEPQWENASSFSEGFAPVIKDGLWGYIGTTGNMVVSYQWDFAGWFFHGLARVKQGGLWGYIDTAGNVIVPCHWDSTFGFCEGLAVVEKDGLWGFIDTAGQVAIELRWEEAYDFDQGFAIVANNNQYGLIDASGEIILDLQWDGIDYFYEELACVEKDEQMGYIDKTGRVVIKPRWDEAEPFENGFAEVWKGGVRFFIDPEGRIIR